MPAVLLHGNPETPVIWEPLVSHLSRTDVITPQLPGFGCPTPDGFGATKAAGGFEDRTLGRDEAFSQYKISEGQVR